MLGANFLQAPHSGAFFISLVLSASADAWFFAFVLLQLTCSRPPWRAHVRRRSPQRASQRTTGYTENPGDQLVSWTVEYFLACTVSTDYQEGRRSLSSSA